jgi:hypothetical protein
MDRIDNNQGYMPGNIRFVSKSDNAKNKRSVGEMQAEIKRLTLKLRQQWDSFDAEVSSLRHRLSWYEE